MLHELVWTLTVGDNTHDSPLQYKLGHGKPLGLGDIKITVEDIELRHFSLEDLEYQIEKCSPDKYTAECPFPEKAKYFKEFMAVIDTRTLAGKVDANTIISYPLGDDGKTHPILKHRISGLLEIGLLNKKIRVKQVPELHGILNTFCPRSRRNVHPCPS